MVMSLVKKQIKEVNFMKNPIQLMGWIAIAFMLSNLQCYPADIALAAPANKAVQSSAVQQPVSINKAGSEELQSVRGIGPALAERILNYRQTNGGFKTLEELKEVHGIGDAKFEKMKSQLTM